MLAGLFLAVTLILGGGGSPSPLPELVVECLAGLTAGLWLLGIGGGGRWQQVPRTAWLIAALVAGLPLLQLVPLPPALWHALPGRGLERDALALIEQQDSWRTWSLAPHRTLASLLSLLPPLLLLAMTSSLNTHGRMTLLRSLVLVGILTAIVGTLQIVSGEGSAFQFYDVGAPAITGFQANRNSTADLLLVVMMAVPLVVRSMARHQHLPMKPPLLLGITGGGMLLFALAVLLTGSRMGIALLPIPLLTGLWLVRSWIHWPRTQRAAIVIVLAVAGFVGLLLSINNPVIAANLARFEFSQELRPQLWRDGLFVVQQHFAFGVGIGNFVPALIADERLEVVRPLLPNRAHNDYIELAAEAGAFGIIALTAISLLITRAAWRARRFVHAESSSIMLLAATALTVLALHSLVDYPFRSMSLASLGAVCAGLLLLPRTFAAKTGSESAPIETRVRS